MTTGKLKWDIDIINYEIQRLEKDKDTLIQSINELKNMKGEVQKNWVGLSGSAYTSNLEIDLQLYQSIIKDLSGAITSLREISNQIYRPCEEEIKQRLIRLSSEIER